LGHELRLREGVIGDDQPMTRAGFKAVLEATGDITVVAEAGTGETAHGGSRAMRLGYAGGRLAPRSALLLRECKRASPRP
jgi:DNA-binding NarL/FixJ family response regulator